VRVKEKNGCKVPDAEQTPNNLRPVHIQLEDMGTACLAVPAQEAEGLSLRLAFGPAPAPWESEGNAISTGCEINWV
jgi:hypothetical protein